MNEVRRSNLLDALLRSVSPERSREILCILEPLFSRCAHGLYPFGNPAEITPDISKHVALLTNRICTAVEPIAEQSIPHAMTTSMQNSNFLAKVKPHAGSKIESSVDHTRGKNLEFDIRYSFGARLTGKLPTNLWVHLWDPIRFWLLAEIGGKHLQKEAEAFEQIVRLSVRGLIIFDFKPTSPTTILVICNQPTSTRYRMR